MEAQTGLPAHSCGSTRGRRVSPNYVECLGAVPVWLQRTILVSAVVGVAPVNGHPQFGMQPVFGQVPSTERYWSAQTCGVRHHVPVTVEHSQPECACGTFAIGRCAQCREPVCGDDSERVGRLRQCWACVQAARDAERVAEEQADAQERESDGSAARARASRCPRCGNHISRNVTTGMFDPHSVGGRRCAGTGEPTTT